MKFLTGKRIFDHAVSLDAIIGQIDAEISHMSDENERRIWAQRLGNVIRSINEELIIPIVKLYPQLDDDSQ